MAAAAAAKVGTGGGHPFGRRLQDFGGSRPHQSGLFLLRIRADPFPGQDKRSEHDAAIEPSQAVASVDQFLHLYFEIA